jgi:hypothetical protein
MPDVEPEWTTNAPLYTSVHLPSNFVPTAIMRDGHIPGSVGSNAAIFYRGTIRTLGTYLNESASARFVNASGDAVGTSSNGSAQRALLFAQGHVTDLGHLPNTSSATYTINAAEAIGDGGAIYGFSTFEGDLGAADIVKFSLVHAPVRLPSANSLAAQGDVTDINHSGVYTITRGFGDAPFGPLAASGQYGSFAFIFGLRASAGAGINNYGHVAGYIDPVNEPYGNAPPFVYWKSLLRAGSSLTILPYLSGKNVMQATGINDRDEIAGSAKCMAPLSCSDSAFLYTGGHVYSVAKLLPALFTGPVVVLPGLSNNGDFILNTTTGYYIAKPR